MRSAAPPDVRVATLVAFLWLSGAGHAAAAGPRVIVRAYNSYGVSEQAARTASRTVQRLFLDAGIDTTWRQCRVVGRHRRHESDPCADPLQPNELIVRIVRGPAITPGEATMALGDAFIDPVTKTGALATIYADRVARTADALRADLGTMTGRAIAHEIAHLLLGTHTHTAVGLMRATWRTTVTIRSEEADWLFTPEQRSVMHLAVATRLASPR